MDLIPRESLEEKIVHLELERQGPWSEAGPVFDSLLDSIHRYSARSLRTIVFGGGTGLSSILGGDTALSEWPHFPFGGLKRDFPLLTVAVCTTDDGGSSGKLLRTLRCVALGDLRRIILSSITPSRLLSQYPELHHHDLETVAACLQRILNYRFSRHPRSLYLKNPAALLTLVNRKLMPARLLDYFEERGRSFLQHPISKEIPLEGQCLGNLLLVSSIYSQSGKPGKDPSDPEALSHVPTHAETVDGIQSFAEKLGAGRETIYPACSTQGEIQVLYQHGVLSSGEAKSSRKHSSFPLHRVWVNFVRKPRVDAELLKKISNADLILLAPGSLYTSLVPLFQIPAITEAIRSNHNAIKILGANFWAQRGETDVSLRRQGKEYYVSDLIEAYHNNIPGGVEGLFESIIVTDLRSIPGDVLRNYALEGKMPIYLDKQRVRNMGFEPIEAAVFSEQKLRNDKVIQHDPEKFARVVRTICFMRQHLVRPRRSVSLSPSLFDPRADFPRKGFLSDYWATACQIIDNLDCRHAPLRTLLGEIIWDNREILIEHLTFIKGIRLVRAKDWTRSTEWDNILGYYEPADGYLKIHEDLLHGPDERLKEDLLIALGESLLGDYCQEKSIRMVAEGGKALGKIFDIQPARSRTVVASSPTGIFAGICTWPK